MTREQCISIQNAIWLCRRHHAIVDGDPVSYPPDLLRRWRAEREEQAKADHEAGRQRPGYPIGRDLISIGPDVCAVGEVVGTKGSEWAIRLDEFVFGNVRDLMAFGEAFEARDQLDRFVLVESFGEGRVLASAPAWTRDGHSLLIRIEVCPPAPRIPAQSLGTDIALTEDGDISFGRRVGGVDALAQKIRTCMSFQKGESTLFDNFGSRLSEFVALYGDGPWLDRLLALEAIRLACIPYREQFLGKLREYTPFQCVSRVISFRFLEHRTVDEWWPASIELEVVGLGRWQGSVKIFIGRHPLPAPPPLPSAGPYG